MAKSNSVHRCQLLPLRSPDAHLSLVENLPFTVTRTFIVHGVPTAQTRGGHANLEDTFIICVSGACEIQVSDGSDHKTFHLYNLKKGLYVPKGIWREILFTQANSVLLVFSEQDYDERLYIRDRDAYLKFREIQE